MHVLKFGGTSMGDENTWHRIFNIIDDYRSPVVIVSATSHTTRQLVAAAEMAARNVTKAKKIAANIKRRHKKLIHNFLAPQGENHHTQIEKDCLQWIERCDNHLLKLLDQISAKGECSLPLQDAVSCIGEQLSAYLFARCGQACGQPTRWVDAKKIVITDSSFGQAVPIRKRISETIPIIAGQVKNNFIPVMGGFYGSNEEGQTTTLGFEGSDYSASLVGAHLQADAIEIWTDVSGIYTCDPSMVKTALPISELSYQEATELANAGAKVLHPSTMQPAADEQIPIKVKNIFKPEAPGTKIHRKESQRGWAKGMACLRGITLLTVTSNGTLQDHQFLSAFFSVLHEARIPVNTATTTKTSVAALLRPDVKIPALENELHSLGTVEVESGQGLISLIGCSFADLELLSRQVFMAIPHFKVSLISYSKSRQNLNIALPEIKLIPTACRIHKALFETASE